MSKRLIAQKLKYVGYSILFLCLWSCSKREAGTFTITGKIEGLPEGMVKVYTYPPSNLLLDSCEIKDGKYFLKGKLEEAQVGMLYFDVKPEYQQNFMPMVRLFLEASDMEVSCNAKDMKGSVKMMNCPLNDRLVACEQYLKGLPEYGRATGLSEKIQLAFHQADMVTVRSLSIERDSLFAVMIDRLFAWEKDADRSEAVAYLANQYSSPLASGKIEEISERFAPDFRSYYYVAQMAEYASKEQCLKEGELFPGFQVFDTTGRKYSLEDFRGKYLFAEFSASWCGWCKKEVPHIRKAYEALKDRNVVFVTFMMDTDREQWLGDIKKEGIDWLCLSDMLGMKKSPMVEAYNLRGLPDSFVVDPQGYIVRRDLRGDEVLQFLSSLVVNNKKSSNE